MTYDGIPEGERRQGFVRGRKAVTFWFLSFPEIDADDTDFMLRKSYAG
jgi:hypothetical protein